MPKKPKVFKTVSFDWPVPPEDRRKIEEFMRSLGYDVDGGTSDDGPAVSIILVVVVEIFHDLDALFAICFGMGLDRGLHTVMDGDAAIFVPLLPCFGAVVLFCVLLDHGLYGGIRLVPVAESRAACGSEDCNSFHCVLS